MCVIGAPAARYAADLDVLSPASDAASRVLRWDGFTIGVNGGGFLAPGQSETQIWFPQSFTTPGIPGAYKLSSHGVMGGVQAGFNKQWGSFVFGAIADYDLVAAPKARQNGAGVYAGLPFNTSEADQLQTLGTIRGRIGFTPLDDMLIYATAGLAFGQTQASSNLSFPSLGSAFAGTHSDAAVGYAARAPASNMRSARNGRSAPNFSITISTAITSSASRTSLRRRATRAPETDSSFAFKGYTLRLGLNYEFDGSNSAPIAGPIQTRAATSWREVGVRAGMSTSRARMTLYDFTGATQISQLTYQNPTAATAEVYGRADHPSSGFFVKGFGGFGKQNGGSLQDEDFPPGISPYSSTNSSQSDGHVNYASFDFGYNALQGSWHKLGGFIGYHFLDERFNAFGCTQTAGNPQICPPGAVGPANLGISDEGRWNSFRLGLAGQLTLPAGFTVKAEGAWLPYMMFSGGNDHWLREPLDFTGTIPETGTGSNGFQARGGNQLRIGEQFRYRNRRPLLVDERQRPRAVSGRDAGRRRAGCDLPDPARPGLRANGLSFLIGARHSPANDAGGSIAAIGTAGAECSAR